MQAAHQKMGVVGARQIFSFRPARLPAALLGSFNTSNLVSIRCPPFRGMIKGLAVGVVSRAGEGEEEEKKAAESTDGTNHAANSGDPGLDSWAKKRQQGNVAHPADVSLALRHKPDSNGPVGGEGCGCGFWLAIELVEGGRSLNGRWIPPTPRRGESSLRLIDCLID